MQVVYTACSLEASSFLTSLSRTIDLSFSGQLIFHYRLKANESWKTTSEKSLLFPALPSGSYRFEVAAKNENSNWSEPA